MTTGTETTASPEDSRTNSVALADEANRVLDIYNKATDRKPYFEKLELKFQENPNLGFESLTPTNVG